ncbi:hypothetical protein ACOSP7_004074 [Xanthoceras sorbifolium]
MNCNVVFYSSDCVFQDQGSGKRIGLAKEINGLYYLETPNNPNSMKNGLSLSFLSESTLNKDKLWFYHLRLGHPSVGTLKVMFPSLFKNLGAENFYCDICEFAKHKRVFFPISNKRSFVSFYLVHSDIWGSSNVSGTKWFVSFIDDCTRVSWIFFNLNTNPM